ncbi:MAG: diguanylate cyclase [Proteobacteria bacterium]|nr:diguanylate cyclase [Pseudomonadota bacterium]
MQKTQLSMLIVEDSHEDRELYKRFLIKDTAYEYLIKESDNGEEALKLLHSEQFNCILIDYRLPDMDGIEFLKTLSEHDQLRRIPSIFLTGQGNEAIAVDALKNCASDYMVKGELTEYLFLNSIHKIIDSKNTENILLDYFAFLETLIDTIPNPIFYKNTKGEYTGCNKAFESSLGLSKDAIIGKTIYDVAPGESAERINKMDQKLFENPGVQFYETQVQYADGTLHDVLLNMATFTKNRGNVDGLVGVMIDITERKSMEVNLNKTKNELESSVAELKKANQMIRNQQKSVIEEERLKLLLQLSGATAHELNQPLMAILTGIEILKLKKAYPKELDVDINRIENAGHEIANIVKNIQSFRSNEKRPNVSGDPIINLDQKLNILSVEDTQNDFEKISSIVKNRGDIVVTWIDNVGDALQAVKKTHFDVIFLDYMFADGTGLDFLRMVKREGIKIPVIVLTGQGSEVIASQMIQEGAYDYIPKHLLSEKSFFRSITNTMEKHRLQRDVREAMKKIAEMSTHDELTGLYNRRYFGEVLERETERSKRYHEALALCIVDLDHFKNINDTYGHSAGDKVLSEIGKILKDCIRGSDVACRYGGEEFAIILTNTNMDNAVQLSKRFIKKLSVHEFEYDDYKFKITGSIGIAALDNSFWEQSQAELIKRADTALYQAKEQGRNRIVVYQENDNKGINE